MPSSVLLAVVVTVLAWASAFIVIRGVGHHLSGGSLALARLLVGTVLLRLLLIGRPWVKVGRREWVLILAYGVLWFGAYNVCLNVAEHTLDAGTAAMLVNLGPILIALGAGLFLGERISRWLAWGSVIAFAGAILISVGAGAVRFDNRLGVTMALTAALAYSIGVLCQKVALKTVPALQLTWLGCVAGAIACLPFSPTLLHELRAAPASAILGAIYLGAVPTAIAFSAWSFALSKLPAAQLGITTYIVPAIVVLLGLAVFHEIPAPLSITGGIIALGGVALSRKRSRPS